MDGISVEEAEGGLDDSGGRGGGGRSLTEMKERGGDGHGSSAPHVCALPCCYPRGVWW